jgi:hypothetical protein
MAILHFRCKERRRTVRVMLSIPLKVHGISTEGETFAVATKTHTVSLHGASLELEFPVQLGDILMIENELTNETRENKAHVGVEFVDSDINFWHMVFPAPGAKPMRRPVAQRQPVEAHG